MAAENLKQAAEASARADHLVWGCTSGVASFYHLKNFGDYAMFLSGYFPDRFRRRVMTPEQMAQMGRRAYQRLGEIYTFGFVFQEMAEQFPDIVDTLHQVRRQVSHYGEHDWKMLSEA